MTGVRIETITDLEGGGKDDRRPRRTTSSIWARRGTRRRRTYTANIGVLPGDSATVQVSYTYTWVPSESVMAAWEAQRQAAVAAATEEA